MYKMKRASIFLPKVETGPVITPDFVPLRGPGTAKAAESPHSQSPPTFLALLCLCDSCCFSFSGSHSVLPAALILHFCTAQPARPLLHDAWEDAILLPCSQAERLPFSSWHLQECEFFGKNERLFIQVYSLLCWLDSNKWEEADGLPQNIKLWHQRLREKNYMQFYTKLCAFIILKTVFISEHLPKLYSCPT